jgi:hypothetical protein
MLFLADLCMHTPYYVTSFAISDLSPSLSASVHRSRL